MNDCCCRDGVLVGQTYGIADGPAGWEPVQRCDACSVFDGDQDAAVAYAATLGPTARARWSSAIDGDGYELGDWFVGFLPPAPAERIFPDGLQSVPVCG